MLLTAWKHTTSEVYTNECLGNICLFPGHSCQFVPPCSHKCLNTPSTYHTPTLSITTRIPITTTWDPVCVLECPHNCVYFGPGHRCQFVPPCTKKCLRTPTTYAPTPIRHIKITPTPTAEPKMMTIEMCLLPGKDDW